MGGVKVCRGEIVRAGALLEVCRCVFCSSFVSMGRLAPAETGVRYLDDRKESSTPESHASQRTTNASSQKPQEANASTHSLDYGSPHFFFFLPFFPPLPFFPLPLAALAACTRWSQFRKLFWSLVAATDSSSSRSFRSFSSRSMRSRSARSRASMASSSSRRFCKCMSFSRSPPRSSLIFSRRSSKPLTSLSYLVSHSTFCTSRRSCLRLRKLMVSSCTTSSISDLASTSLMAAASSWSSKRKPRCTAVARAPASRRK
mmetsp:Transcript_52/g.183  ORF Transcript_52/g.183 Transcript_52/m.183 type:complete len:258 (-) Transcript_52:859-1632(-)